MNKLALTAVTLTAGWCLACAAPAPAPQPATATPATPQVAVGAHTATLGLAFYGGEAFPAEYRGGAFLGQHGSWNRSQFSGYKVTFVPSSGGRPSGPMRDFLTGFVADEARSEVYGRPVSIVTLADGSLLVADDAGNTVWRVSAAK